MPYHWELIAVDIANKEMKALEIDETEQGVIITEIKTSIDEFDKGKNKPADTAVTRKIVYQTIGKHYAKAKGFTEAQIEAFNKVVEREAAVSMKEASDLKVATESAVRNFFEQAVEELKKGVEDAKAAAKDAKKDAEDAADAAKKDGESAVDSVNKGVEGVTTGVGEAMSGAVDAVNKGVGGVATGISETFKNL